MFDRPNGLRQTLDGGRFAFHNCLMYSHYFNDRKADHSNELSVFSPEGVDPLSFHQMMPGYAVTPLHSLPGLASKLGVGQILVKDESQRFDLKAFKILGASYAVYRLVAARLKSSGLSFEGFWAGDWKSELGDMTFCTATDGNHGRGVARMARLLKLPAVIYMPQGTVAARIENIKKEGAEVIVVGGNYDLAVQQAFSDSKTNKWTLISDTSFDGYEQIPRWITTGYQTIFHEIEQSLNSPKFDFVFVQAGVGALAATAGQYFRGKPESERPKMICVEPVGADCLLRSAREGRQTEAPRECSTIMAGLNCGTPSMIAWPIVHKTYDLFLGIPDECAAASMRLLHDSVDSDPQICSGESGAAGVAGLVALLTELSFKTSYQRIKLGHNSRVLVINTEGDTDPANYRQIVSSG